MDRDQQLTNVLVEFAETMITDFPIKAILDHLVLRIVDVMPISSAGVTLISQALEPHMIAASNDSALSFETLQTKLREGPCIAAFQEGIGVQVPDLRSETRFGQFTPQALSAGLGAVFTFPLRHGSHRLGALDLYRDTPGPLSPQATVTAQTLADVASAYIINAQVRADLQETSNKSRSEALHDGLTGLPNRMLMLERLEISLLRSKRSGLTSAVLYIDLDRFKSVNDTFGHEVGDELLVAVAERLGEGLRPGDTLARMSGDEFVVLCDELVSPALAECIAQRFSGALARPFKLSGVDLEITASVGVAFAGHGSFSPEEVLSIADSAMYEAKRAGSGSHHAVDLHDLSRPEGQSTLKVEMLGLLDRGELCLDYQPIVNTDDSCLTGTEALIRWAHPTRGTVAPNVLIPLAEKMGMIRDIGAWVLAQALSDQLRWHVQPHPASLDVSVNVSALQFMSPGFAESVVELLDASHSTPESLTLEVTETVFIRDGDRAVVVFHDLHDIGVKLALDDFGTGYSSLSYLMRFPVDCVKIDKSFIAGLGHDGTSKTLVAAVIGLAHGLGMYVVAEGVESLQQHRVLATLGCDSCQGFYYSRPLPAGRFDDLLRSQDDSGDRTLPTPNSAPENLLV